MEIQLMRTRMIGFVGYESDSTDTKENEDLGT